MDKEELKINLENSISHSIALLEQRKIEDKGKYVMVNDDYIQVERDKGLNFTNVNVRCDVTSCKVACYANADEAYRSADYYLKNGAGVPILLHPMKAENFFAEEIKKAHELIEFIGRLTK